MRADQSSSTIKRNNMELGKHVQLILVSLEQQMLPTCRRLLFPFARGSRFVCLVCLFVCVFFSSRHISPIEDINATAIKNMILRYVSKNKKIRLCPFKRE